MNHQQSRWNKRPKNQNKDRICREDQSLGSEESGQQTSPVCFIYNDFTSLYELMTVFDFGITLKLLVNAKRKRHATIRSISVGNLIKIRKKKKKSDMEMNTPTQKDSTKSFNVSLRICLSILDSFKFLFGLSVKKEIKG